MDVVSRTRAAMLFVCIVGAVLWQCNVQTRDAHAGAEPPPPAQPHNSLSCGQCHPEDNEASMNDTVAFCVKCHEASTGEDSHPTGVSYDTESPADLPLSEDGKIECYTCHIMHEAESAAPKLLRKDFNSLCTSCHPGGKVEHPH